MSIIEKNSVNRPFGLSWRIVLFLLTLALSGCAGPVGVNRVSPEYSYLLSTDNPMSDEDISNSVAPVLHRYNLLEEFARQPEKTILQLHELTKTDDRRDILLALSELSYLYGEKLEGAGLQNSMEDREIKNPERAPDYFLQAAVYAYYYLLGDGREPAPSSYDVRFREACDLYNRALWQAFSAKKGESIVLASGKRRLPVGDISLEITTDKMGWKLSDILGFYPADAYQIRGFSVRNRNPGLGLPLIAITAVTNESPTGGALPVTAFLRLPKGIKEFHGNMTTASLELYSAYDSAEVQVNGKTVPLETDSTAPLAYRLNNSEQWNIGVLRFLTGDTVKKKMLFLQPYEQSRIPVVFVHGTASSPVWWAEMINTLRADPDIRQRFQFWFFQYNSSNLIMLSAADLRETLTDQVHKLDPQGTNPDLQKMVVIGHSQGGLLTKMTAIKTEDKLWKAISDQNIETMNLDPDVEALLRRGMFFDPLPFVKRVVFISTPHRGSFLTKDWVRDIVSKVITFPLTLPAKSISFLQHGLSQFKLPTTMKGKIPTSIDGMSPESPILQSLVTIPLRPGVVGHSIVAVKPDMEDIATGNDGVVEYQSAHIDGVESEFVVRSGHSCQEHPYTIGEVRRILLEHVGLNHGGQAQGIGTSTPENSHLGKSPVAEQSDEML